MDKDKIKQGVQLIIEGIGEDASREGLVETPDRIARMYEEIFAGLNENASVHLSKTFSTQNTDMIIRTSALRLNRYAIRSVAKISSTLYR